MAVHSFACCYVLHVTWYTQLPNIFDVLAGVSNFSLQQLVELVEVAEIPPAVVQRHNDVFEQDTAVHQFCMMLGIQYVAYSSLGTQHLLRLHHNPVLTNAAVGAIATASGASPAQVCMRPAAFACRSGVSCQVQCVTDTCRLQVVLKYALGTAQVVIPRSTSRSHMNESLYLHMVHFGAQDLNLLQSLGGKLHLVE
jgi:diketogulonate reductase-like aldo/keto reductase